jgi:hypothetical protein
MMFPHVYPDVAFPPNFLPYIVKILGILSETVDRPSSYTSITKF